MNILIAHAALRASGGAEAYALALIDALRAGGHRIGVLDIDGHRPPHAPPTRPRLLRLGETPGLRTAALWHWALVCRTLPQIAPAYDRVICTFGEGPALPVPSARILHAPVLFGDTPDLLHTLGAPTRGLRFRLRRAYARGCTRIARPVMHPGDGITTLANSRWTAGMAQAHRGLHAVPLLYPPVTAPQITETWRDPYRMIAVGRIVPNKRLEQAVALLDALRAEGLPATLQIIGRANSRYARRFLRRYARHPHLTLTPDAPPDALAQALAHARIGVHLYEGEHFGISVAEMICAGVLPMVHDSGGVRELACDPRLRATSLAEATVKTAALMRRPEAACARLLHQITNGPALPAALDFAPHARRALAAFLGETPPAHSLEPLLLSRNRRAAA